MSSVLHPYFSFDGNAREAMEFYQQVFGGQLEVMTFGQMGGEPADGVMHSSLQTTAGYQLMGADSPGDEGASPNGSVSLSGDDGDELRGYFEKLADGGTVTLPLEKQMWGDVFGMCTDRFGIGWMVNIADPG